jgi:hypothetical protein
MLELAKKYDVSVKEIEETMLRSFLIERFGFRCDHPEKKISIRRDGTQDHCIWCWTFIDVIQKRETFTNPMGRVIENRAMKYKPIRNQFEEDLRRMLRHEDETEGLQPDKRGGQ